jgi:hypothetical protein
MRLLFSRLPRLLAVATYLVALTLPALPVERVVAGSDDPKLDEIGRIKRGRQNVPVRIDVGDVGMTCQLKLKYADGNADTPDDVISNSKGICELRFDVPDRKSVVGDAIAKVKVLNKKGGEVGRTSGPFQVRDGRN